MFPRLPVSVPCVAVLGFACPVRAQVIASEWNTGSGQWSVPGNWAPAEVPGNAGGRTYLVQIGNRAAAAGAQVNLAGPAGGGVSIAGLTLTGAGTALSTNDFWLSVSGQTTVEGASVLSLKPSAAPVSLETGTLLLAGQGTVDLIHGGAAVKGRATLGAGTQFTGEGSLVCGNTDAVAEKALDNMGRIVCRSHSTEPGILTLSPLGSDTLDLDGENETGILDVANAGTPGLSDELTLNVNGPLSDAFSGKLIVGQRDTIWFSSDFTLAGADITLTGGDATARMGGPGKITSAAGTTFRVSGRGVIGNGLTLSGGANKVLLDTGGALDLRGPVTFPEAVTLTAQGAGRIDFSGGLTVNEESSIEAEGTVSLDGISETSASAVQVNAPLSVFAKALDPFGRPGFPSADVLTINHPAPFTGGQLLVALANLADTWRVTPDGVLRLQGGPSGQDAPVLLRGAGVRVEGRMEVAGAAASQAQIIVPAGGVIDPGNAATQLRLGGGAAMEVSTLNGNLNFPPGTNRLEGGTIKGTSVNQLVVETNRALSGWGRIEAGVDARNATVLADGGTLTLSHASPLAGARLVGANKAGSVLEIPAAWNTQFVTEMWLGGGELRGGVLTLTNNSQLSGFGLVSMPLTVSGGIVAVGGTLVLAEGGNSNLNGRLRAVMGTLEIRGGEVLPRFLTAQTTIMQGGTVLFKGMAVNMQPGSTTLLRGGTLRSNRPLTLGGTVSSGDETLVDSSLVMEGDALLDFGAARVVVVRVFHISARQAILRAGTVCDSLTGEFEGTLSFESGTGVRVEPGVVLNCIVENHGRMELDVTHSQGSCHLRDLRLQAGSVLALPLCGTGAVPCASLAVDNVARLTGTLELTLAGGYVPHEGDRLEVLTAGSGIIGKFSRIVQPANMPPGLMFVPDVTLFPDVLHLTATATTPYELWRKSYAALTEPETFAKAADPDGDGLPNIGEFALHGDPSRHGDTLLFPRVLMVNGVPLCVCTVPVRAGAVPDPNDLPGGSLRLSQAADGLRYTLQGSPDLLTWNADVTELTGADATAIQAELPALDGEWEYRTFTAGESGKYLRVTVTE